MLNGVAVRITSVESAKLIFNVNCVDIRVIVI